MTNIDYDLLIIGGGLAGASLACALARQPLRIAMIEAVPFDAAQQPAYDDRAIALSFGTRRIFEGLGLWAHIARYATPIEKIHVSDRGHFGFTHLDCTEEGVAALGYVVIGRELGATLTRQIQQQDNLTLFCPARLTGLNYAEDHITATVATAEGERQVRATLVAAADGGNSLVRELLNIEASSDDYGQTAIIANITPGKPHQNTAYERFTDSGPLALLPMSEGRCALVWTQRHADVTATMQLSDAAFLARLQERFGYRLGRLQHVGERHAYPLRLLRAKEQVRPRLALIGNAAHTIHPIAGQGFNLGIRDVSVLAEVICQARRAGQDIGALDTLQRYRHWREQDHDRVIRFTDSLVRIFSNPSKPLALARNLGLSTLDLCPPLKRLLSRQAMGLLGKQPRLNRGLPL
ncbi:MAG: 2-octaprenyl-6-methoxyphenyl hydroxylase [Pseudomonadota bacterium]